MIGLNEQRFMDLRSFCESFIATNLRLIVSQCRLISVDFRVRLQAESRALGQLRLLKATKARNVEKAFEEFDPDGDGEVRANMYWQDFARGFSAPEFHFIRVSTRSSRSAE